MRAGVQLFPWCRHILSIPWEADRGIRTETHDDFIKWSQFPRCWPFERGIHRLSGTVYPKKYAHGFVVLCFVVVMQSFIMNSHEEFIHIHQGCFAGTGAIVRLPQCQWSKPDGYWKISQCITTTKHIKAKTVCILGYTVHLSFRLMTFNSLPLGKYCCDFRCVHFKWSVRFVIFDIQGDCTLPSVCKRTDVSPQNLAKSRSREIWCYNDFIALKFDRHLGSAVAEVAVKFQNDWKCLNLNLTAPWLHEILR